MKMQKFERLKLQMHALANPLAEAKDANKVGYYAVYDKSHRWVVGLTANK